MHPREPRQPAGSFEFSVLSFELFDPTDVCGEGPGRHSKLKTQNSKLDVSQTAMQQSELQISENGTPSPEKR